MSFTPGEDPAGGPVTRSFTPLVGGAGWLGPLAFVGAGTPRSHWPVVAVSVPFGLVVQPLSVSKSSEKTTTGATLVTANARSSRSLKLPDVHGEAAPWKRICPRTVCSAPEGRV